MFERATKTHNIAHFRMLVRVVSQWPVSLITNLFGDEINISEVKSLPWLSQGEWHG
jgi:hypothetical protein